MTLDDFLLHGKENAPPVSDADLVWQIAMIKDLLPRLEAEAFRRMEERGGTQLSGDTHVINLIRDLQYDPARLTPLLEILPAEEVARCYTPAHEKTVVIAEAWDLTRTKAAARKVGNAALKVIEDASSLGRGRLKVERKA